MHKFQFLISLFFSLSVYSSDPSEYMDRFQTNVICNLRAVNAVPDVHDRCSNEGIKTSDLIGLLSDVSVCHGSKIKDIIKTKESNHDKN